MDTVNTKCVMVVDEALPAGVAANTAAILGLTLGMHRPEAIGPDVLDKEGHTHLGIIAIPVPILKAGADKVRQIREQLFLPEFSKVLVVDFSDVAQSCNDYGEFTDKLAGTEEATLSYFGLGIYGPKKLVNKLTGSLPLLR